jgi:hypothetical protein
MRVAPTTRMLILIAIVIAGALPLAAGEIRVPDDVRTLQEAIDMAEDGDTVTVGDGTWSGKGWFDITFGGKAITVASENGPENCAIDCEFNGRGFIFADGEGRSSVLRGFTVQYGSAQNGAGIYCEGASPTITGNILQFNSALYRGGAIHCFESSALIESNWIIYNDAGWGGGISCRDSSPAIRGNQVSFNVVYTGEGGGLRFDGCSALLENDLVDTNTAATWGGGIACRDSVVEIRNCTIADNTATDWGGGLGAMESSTVSVSDSILYWDVAGEGAEIGLRSDNYPSRLSISYSDVAGGRDGVYLEAGCVLNWWGGMIDADPLFASGPGGGAYLSQVAAGQLADSPCVDAGNPGGPMIEGSTRTDSAQDTGVVDMGYHYVIWEEPVTSIDAGPSGTIDSPVVVFLFSAADNMDDEEDLRFSWRLDDEAWSAWTPVRRAVYRDLRETSFTFSVRSRDTDGNIDATPAERTFSYRAWDDQDDWGPLVTGPGPGPANPSLVRTSSGEWEAYSVGRYGVNVAAGNVDGLGFDEIITGPGPGENLGPHVRGFQVGGSAISGISFLAYGTPRYGVNVACGDVDGDGIDEIITGAGPGMVFGPHVRGWNYDGGAAVAIDGVNFFAYGTLKWGVNVACGDIDGDGADEIVTGAGPGEVFGPHVRGWDHDGGASTDPIGLVSFMAYGTLKWGVNVACGDLDGDGIEEILTGVGPGPSFGANVRGWNYDGEALTAIAGIDFLSSTSGYGVVVAAWDLDDDGQDEILTMPGPGESLTAYLRAYRRSGTSVELVSEYTFVAYDSWMTHGGKVCGGNF